MRPYTTGTMIDGSSPARTDRIAALDGLRGFAAITVVFHHCFIWPMLFGKGIIDAKSFRAAYMAQPLPVMLWYGYSGVELFFILSGFCLLYQVFSRPERPYNLKTYAVHRFRRIYPPYFVSLIAAVCLAVLA